MWLVQRHIQIFHFEKTCQWHYISCLRYMALGNLASIWALRQAAQDLKKFLLLSGAKRWSKGSSDKWRNVFSPFRQRWSLEIAISRSEKGWSGIIYSLLAHLSPSGTTRLALHTILLRLYSSPSFVRRVNPGAHWIWIGVGWSCCPTFFVVMLETLEHKWIQLHGTDILLRISLSSHKNG